jgi:hypothetical protein
VTAVPVAGDGVLGLREIELDRSLVDHRLRIVDEQRPVPLQRGGLAGIEGGDDGAELQLLEPVQQLVECILGLCSSGWLDPALGDVQRLLATQAGLLGGREEHAEIPAPVDLDGGEGNVELRAGGVVELRQVDVVAVVEDQFTDRQRLAVDLGVDLTPQLEVRDVGDVGLLGFHRAAGDRQVDPLDLGQIGGRAEHLES